MSVKIHVFGNLLLNEDSLPLRFLPRLRRDFPDIEFIEFDPNENLKPENKKIIIIDTIEGADDVVVIDDIRRLRSEPMYSAHDLDLGFNLQLLHKLGRLDSILVFGLPMKSSDNTYDELCNKIIKYHPRKQL